MATSPRGGRSWKVRRYLKHGVDDDVFIGVRMGQVFALANKFIDITPRPGALSDRVGSSRARPQSSPDRRHRARGPRRDGWPTASLPCGSCHGAGACC